MALNPNIALGVKGIEVANPMAQYAQVAQLQSLQNQNQVSQMQLDQMRRDEATLQQIQAKAVEHGGPADLNQIADAYLKSGNPKFVEFGIGLRQKLDDRENIAKIMSMGQPPAARPAPAVNALAPTMQAGALGSGTFGMAPEPVNRLAPAVAPAPAANALAAPGGASVDTLLAQQNAFIAMGRPELARALDARIALASKEPVYHNVTGVGLVDPRTARVVMPSVEKPPAPPSMVAEYTFAKTPDGGNFRGSYQDFVTARAAAGRAPVQPVAPTITQIVDPSDPNKMITIDARRYQGGGAGSPGVIGVSGKEPSAALRENKTEAGKTQLADDLENLRFSFQKLDSLRAIPSTERNALSNVTSGLASTAIGQRTGQLFATEAQVERDVINSARSRLVNSIKNATGMSAQQLNSNVELQTMLKSISDPGQSYQSAIRIIEDIEDAYVKGKGMKNRGEPAPAPAATQGTGGFKYLGKESTK
jgi:hypothetical protein